MEDGLVVEGAGLVGGGCLCGVVDVGSGGTDLRDARSCERTDCSCGSDSLFVLELEDVSFGGKTKEAGDDVRGGKGEVSSKELLEFRYLSLCGGVASSSVERTREAGTVVIAGCSGGGCVSCLELCLEGCDLLQEGLYLLLDVVLGEGEAEGGNKSNGHRSCTKSAFEHTGIITRSRHFVPAACG